MKAVFAHDHRFIMWNGKFHSRGGLPEPALARYSNFFGEVIVLCRMEQADPGDLKPIENADISFAPQEDIRRLANLTSFFRVKRSISRLVKQSDIVIARLPSALGWLAATAARKQGKSCIVEVVGNAREAASLHGSVLGSIVGRIEHHFAKREIRDAKHVIYITERYLQTVYPTRGSQYVCPNVSVTSQPNPNSLMRDEKFAPIRSPRIGLIGSLDVNYKGHGTAISVVARLIRDYGFTNASLHFAGGGGQDRWKAVAKAHGIENHVALHGSIPPGGAMISWISEMDMMLQPSLTEGQGRSIIEAMALGKPIVASNVGGIPELIESRWMTEPLDIEGLAERCALLLENPSLYRLVANTNQVRARDFDSARIEKVRQRAFSAALNGIRAPGDKFDSCE